MQPTHPGDGPRDEQGRPYQAPIPPVSADGAPPPQGPRYVHAEPIPGTGGEQRGFPPPGFPPAGFPPPGGGPGAAFPGVAFQLPLAVPRKKSIPVAAALAVLGPIGMVYSTVLGALVMFPVWFFAAIAAFAGESGSPVVFAWLLGIVWAASAAHRTNRRIDLLAAHLGAPGA